MPTSPLIEASLEKLHRLRDLQARAEQLEQQRLSIHRERWRNDPVAWVRERLGEHVWTKQAEIMESVRDNTLTAVQSGHGVGKSHVASRLIAWAIDTSEPGTTFVVTTAPRWQQVQGVLWRYIGQIHRRHDLPGRVTQMAEWKIGEELVGFGRKPADHDESGFQGYHADRVFVVIDEAGGVPAQLWNAVDSLVTTDESRVLAIGNPDSVSSHFHKVCTTEPGWHRLKISAFDSPNFTGEPVPEPLTASLVSQDWVADKALRWGEGSPLYRIKVQGEFADDDANALIPMAWVRAAIDRWHAWHDHPLRDTHQPAGRRVFGVDVAMAGEDLTCIAARQGDVVMSVDTWAQLDTIKIANLVAARLAEHAGFTSVIDSIGVGAGVLDVLRHRGCNAQAFIASAGTKRRDVTGTQGFPNKRSAAWWHLRELLDPALGATLALPDDDDLVADLTTPKWEPVTGGKIVVEPKDKVKARIGRSTDRGDAVVMACWVEGFARPDDGEQRSVPRSRSYANSVQWDNF